MKKDYYHQYTTISYSGVELLKKHSLDEEGTWQVLGEDPNCGFSGSHHQPYLATLQGKLRDVIGTAVELPGFWQWGSGGAIKLISVKKVNPYTIKKRIDNTTKIASLQAAIKQLEDEQNNQ